MNSDSVTMVPFMILTDGDLEPEWSRTYTTDPPSDIMASCAIRSDGAVEANWSHKKSEDCD